ncbi:MAG: response regulator [Thermodesulfobacteriota bacterium]|nr:response regulator [Thermodesulfobacteriota bacterium]
MEIEQEGPAINRALLVVDDEPNVLRSIQRQLRHEGYSIKTTESPKAALDLLRENDFGVVLSDHMMPEMDGVTFLESAKQQKPDVVRILLTGYGSLENAMEAIRRSQIFGYLTKPWSNEALKRTLATAFDHYNLVTENKRLERLTKEQNKQLNFINKNLENLVHQRTQELEEAVREGILMLATAAEAKDDDTGEHVYRIRDMTLDLCLVLGLPSKESDQISFMSMMHDVGKIHIPDSILKKRGPLTDEEFEVMKTHTVVGDMILGHKPFYKYARETARSHHECWDGTGYPDGLKGDAIPFSARIVTVVDVFDALTHARPYKPAWPKDKAIAEIKALSGKKFDPRVAEAFLKTQAPKAAVS